MFSILFVCHGNICRSPMAECVMKNLVKKAGRASEFFIDSAATSREEIGNPIHRGTKLKLYEMGVAPIDHFAVQMTRSDYAEYDLIIAMDHHNLRNIRHIIHEDPEGKVRLLLPDRDIADPWYTGNFDETYADVLEGCKALLEQI